ncbi:hypothetical protein [Bacillus toyonensis]|uniref:hypothetical protein n=1 Tax=Bacillus toyonensis TaxID=155322 RepID=UPI0015CF264F|nr:hypothetical protein [Bacillus toyonensis]
MRRILIVTLKGLKFETTASSVTVFSEEKVIHCKDFSGREALIPMTSIHYFVDTEEAE